jgi:hypothetical protein
MKRATLYLSLAALAASLLYLGAWRVADSGPGVTPSPEGLAMPLDDAYIFAQYARQALRGEWLHYTPGAPISTGVSSAAYLLTLTGAMGLGLPAPWAAWLIGLGCLLWSLNSAQRLSRRLFPTLPDWLPPLLFLANASFVSQFFQGMDTGLFLALLLAALEAAADPRADGRFWALAAGLAFCRPEGQLAVPCLALARAWTLPRRWTSLALGLGLAALPSLGLWALSGSATPDSVRSKSEALKALPLPLHAAISGRYAAKAAGAVFMGLAGADTVVGMAGSAAAGNPPGRHFPPLALALAAAGFWLALKDRRRRLWWLGLAAWWLLAFGALCWNLPVGWHRHRYLAALSPGLLLGLAALLDRLNVVGYPGGHKARPYIGSWGTAAGTLRVALLTLWAGFGFLQWPWFLKATAQSASRYATVNRQAAFALRALPEAGPVALEDAGLLAWYSGRSTIDLLGVTDHAFALAQGHGREAVLAAYAARVEKPAYAALHVVRSRSSLEGWSQAADLKLVLDVNGMGLYRWNERP